MINKQNNNEYIIIKESLAFSRVGHTKGVVSEVAPPPHSSFLGWPGACKSYRTGPGSSGRGVASGRSGDCEWSVPLHQDCMRCPSDELLHWEKQRGVVRRTKWIVTNIDTTHNIAFIINYATSLMCNINYTYVKNLANCFVFIECILHFINK